MENHEFKYMNSYYFGATKVISESTCKNKFYEFIHEFSFKFTREFICECSKYEFIYKSIYERT